MTGALRSQNGPKSGALRTEITLKPGHVPGHFGPDTNCGEQKVPRQCAPERAPPQPTGITQHLLQRHVPGHFYALS
jgi:hypothetical protein